MSNKVILFNPRSANSKYRIPNSILQVGASIQGKFEYVLVDGNLEKDPYQKIKSYLDTGEFKYLGMTVMPGPQLSQAIPFAKKAKEEYPNIVNIWGGYFPANQYKVVVSAPYIDFAINGPGDNTFPALLMALENDLPYEFIPNLIYQNQDGDIIKTQKESLLDQDRLAPLPYDYLNTFYPIEGYLGKTYLGQKTLAYHSSVGCPFKCSFCAVVPIYNARWRGKSAENIYKDVMKMKKEYGADAIEFHDNNFFVSEKRVAAFSKMMLNENMIWWGEGRIDTIDKYSDETLHLMRKAGCKMIFYGAESGNDDILKQMDKGGKQTAEQIKSFAARMKKVDIIPEYSFVLGLPAETPQKVMAQIDSDIQFIKEIKKINPNTEIIIYMYSPVPTEGSELFERITEAGFQFPEKLEDWITPQWQNFDLRKNPLTPWLTPAMVDKIKNFETVLNAYYPTVSDTKLSKFQRKVMRSVSAARYKTGLYKYPYELKVLQRFWLKYRQPEIEGF
ncbi:MAG: B12-binding domain-containing radical SAM protein [Aureispira sp.]|nr:B12-binding domain-containing radical SAM protein [Aureispira sp.]